MTRKYETRCWLCSSKDLEPDTRGMRCKSCGATFNLVIELGVKTLSSHYDPATGQASSSPSVAIQHQITE